MEKNTTPLVDEHLRSMQGMTETGTDEFFFTRLKARMEREHNSAGWSLPLKPVWAVATLALLLAVNGFMLSQQVKTKKQQAPNTASIQRFAESYDQSLSSSY